MRRKGALDVDWVGSRTQVLGRTKRGKTGRKDAREEGKRVTWGGRD